MGNIAAFDQLPSPIRSLNEDNMVVLLQYLEVEDYVHLTATCRKFLHETLGPNNYFWAQLINRSWKDVPGHIPALLPLQQQPYPVRYPAQPPQVGNSVPHPTQLANHVLQTTRNGRRFEVDGKPLDLMVPFDTLNKKLGGHFDFRNEIKMYFFKAKLGPSLVAELAKYTILTNARLVVRVEEIVNLGTFYYKPILPLQAIVSDVTFVVDLGVDGKSLENLKRMQLLGQFKLRRVVYEKRDVPAVDYTMMSRSRMPPPKHDMMFQPIPQPFAVSHLQSHLSGPMPSGPYDLPQMPSYQPADRQTPTPRAYRTSPFQPLNPSFDQPQPLDSPQLYEYNDLPLDPLPQPQPVQIGLRPAPQQQIQQQQQQSRK